MRHVFVAHSMQLAVALRDDVRRLFNFVAYTKEKGAARSYRTMPLVRVDSVLALRDPGVDQGKCPPPDGKG